MNMTTYNMDTDAGNGFVNSFLYTKRNERTSIQFPSVRSQSTGNTLDVAGFEMDYQIVNWCDQQYIVGNDVLRVSRQRIERHTGRDRYGNDFHKMLVAVSAARLGVGTPTKRGNYTDKVHLTLFLPPGLYNAQHVQLTNAFMVDPAVELHIVGEDAPRRWEYSSVTVWPETMCAAVTVLFTPEGKQASYDFTGTVRFFDIGAHTFDVMTLQDGHVNPEDLDIATYEGQGMDRHIRRPMLKDVKAAGMDFRGATVEDIDEAIVRGSVSGDYTFRMGQAEISSDDFSARLEVHAENYALWIKQNVIDSEYDGLAGTSKAVFVGGGEHLVTKYLRQVRQYEAKVFDPSAFDHVRKVHGADLNAMGPAIIRRVSS